LKVWNSSNIWDQQNQSKLYLRTNPEQNELGECLLSFGAESFVLQFAVQTILR
jgi:hypothetical protein